MDSRNPFGNKINHKDYQKFSKNPTPCLFSSLFCRNYCEKRNGPGTSHQSFFFTDFLRAKQRVLTFSNIPPR